MGYGYPTWGRATQATLRDLLPDAATVGNPLDYTSMIWAETELLANIVRSVGEDPAIDQLLLLYDHPRDLAPESEAEWAAVRRGLLDGAEDCQAATLLASTLPDLVSEDANRECAARGVPPVGGLTTALACVKALRGPPGDAKRLREIAAAATPRQAERPGVHPRGGQLGRSAGRGSAEALSEGVAKGVLRAAGVAVPEGGEADDADGAVAIAVRIGWPVALKLSAPEITHKSEIGGIALGIEDEAELRAACERLASSPLHRRTSGLRTHAVVNPTFGAGGGVRFLVERMEPRGLELIVAARADAVVPALIVGLGGVWTEALADAVVIPLPADAARIERALQSLRGAPLLFGARAQTSWDIGALCGLCVQVAELLGSGGHELIELNPVVVHLDGEGCVALDAVVR